MHRSETTSSPQERLRSRWNSNTYNRRSYGWINTQQEQGYQNYTSCEVRKGVN